MVGWIRRRNRSAALRLRFITDTIDALDLLHQRVGHIEEQLQQLQQQQATARAHESHTVGADAGAPVARREAPDLIAQYSGIHETHDSGQAEPPLQLLDSLMPILTPIRSKRAAFGREAAEGDPSDGRREHVCLVSSADGYELLERPGVAPMAGTVVDLGEGLWGEVVKVGRSPLPNDKRRCAYLLQAEAVATVEADMLSLELVSSSS